MGSRVLVENRYYPVLLQTSVNEVCLNVQVFTTVVHIGPVILSQAALYFNALDLYAALRAAMEADD